MEICIFQGAEIHKTRKLYEAVFQDSKAYTDWFYQKAEKECTAIAAMEDCQVIGEVFLVPKEICRNGRREKCFYIYGVATAVEHRGKGIMKALVKQAEAYAKQEKVTLLYLIPVDERIYEPLKFQLVKKGSIKNYEFSGKDDKTMLQSVGVSKNVPYKEVRMLEQEVYALNAVIPLRDESYFAERIGRIAVEEGEIRAFYHKDTGKLRGICITEEREEGPAIVDMICRDADKEALIQCYLQEKKLSEIREYVFPVMMKKLDGKSDIAEGMKVFLNDEI